MTDYEHADFFRDKAIQDDPYAWFDWVREHGPVWQEPTHGVFIVAGHAEATEVYVDPGTFSSCNAVSGPFVPFSEPFEGDDVSDVIDRCRHELPFSDQLPAFDPPRHTDHRHLMSRLITPKGLKENEEFMWRYADRLIDTFHAAGRFEAVHGFAEPFTLTVIADLEGVPEADHDLFRDRLSTTPREMEHKPLEFLYERFTEYIEQRRAEPTDDVIGGLAAATFPDGSVPEVEEAALLAANLFAGGQETTVRLLTFALQALGERPDLQATLREDRSKIRNFLEECLRLESPLRTQFRMARVATTVGTTAIPAGGVLMLVPGAANRDPRVFEDPHTLDLDRPNARQHQAFGHGIHTCIGAPLARAEGWAMVNRMLDRLGDITVSEEHHGGPGERRYEYLRTFFLRGLKELYLEFTPLG